MSERPDAAELEFEAERMRLLRSRIRTTLAWGALLYACFYVLDLLVAPAERRWAFLALRAIGIGTFLATITAAKLCRSDRLVIASSIASALSATLGIATMTFFLGGFKSTYYVGLTVPMYIVGLLFPWTKREGFAFLMPSLAYYMIGNAVVTSPYGEGVGLAAVEAFFFVGVAVVYTMISLKSHERSRYADFALRKDLERANRELRELDRLKTAFFSNVSHELRTPLTLILSPLSSVVAEVREGPLHRTLEMIQANAVRLLKLINTLLDFARVDEGRVQLNVDHHDLGELIRRIVDSARPFAEGRSIRLACDIAAGLPLVWSDREMIENVVYNLLSNALKFTPAGGDVAVTARAEEERLWVAVRDSGPGVPPEARDHIFERFQHSSSHSRASGSGIGLSLARELVRLHHGDLELASGPGIGAEFRFWLPLKNPLDGRAINRRGGDRRGGERREGEGSDAPCPSQIPGATSADADGSTKHEPAATGPAERRSGGDRRVGADRRDSSRFELPRLLFEASEYGPSSYPDRDPASVSEGTVLVADDHREMRDYIRGLLADRYTIIEAANGREALEKSLAERPDVILADYMMPELDGMELTARVRAEAATALIPVIVITARAELSARLGGLAGGANDYLVKPFHPEELRAKVGAFMRMRRFEREIADKTASLERTLAELEERETRLAGIGRMTSTIVHDLRNPLTSIVGFSTLALETAERSGHEEIATDLRPVVEEAERLRRMLEEVLAFARGAAGRLDLERVRLGDLLRSTMERIAGDLAAKKIQVDVDVSAIEDATVFLNRDATTRALDNLIRNACEAIEARDRRDAPGPGAAVGGHVMVRATPTRGTVSILVADDGCGIPSELRGRLFRPFATSGKAGGTGLGLAAVQSLIRAQGGDVHAEPDSPLGGAAFRVELPLASSSPLPGAVARAQ